METLITPNEKTDSPAMTAKDDIPGAPAPPASFHLIMDPGAGQDQAAAPEKRDHLEVPAGVSYLRADATAPRRLEKAPPHSRENVLVFEPVTHQGRLRLLLVAPAGTDVRANDKTAPLLTLLKEGDIIQVNYDTPLEVAVYWRPAIGKPPSGMIGEKCLTCRTAFTENSRIYRCQCNKAMHLDAGDEESALKCALMTPHCPACNRPVMLEAGYSKNPEFHRDE